MNQRLLRELVHDEHRRGATVLFSTHVMVHAEQLCDHVVMIHRGDKVLDDEIGAIRARYDPRNLLFEPLDPAADVSALARIGAWRWSARTAPPGTSPWRPPPARRRSSSGWPRPIPPARVELRRPTLEDVFIDIVSAASVGGDDATLRAAVRDDGDGRREPRP